ncbi:MAG: IS66 family transposase [Acidobacteriota bacterium]|nr:IS66 family transposase [Acidobacteriota bacterium]
MSGPREEELARQLQAREAELRQAKARIALLEQKIDLLVRRIFGAKSEKLDAAQLELLLALGQEDESGKAEASVEAEAIPCKDPLHRNNRARSNEPRWPADMVVIEEVIEPEPVKAAPQEWRCIGEEVSEQLDYEPARFIRRRLIRRKYVHRQQTETAPVIAALPQKLQERCIAAPGLLAQILVSKYCDHLPLYRQEQIYRSRHQVHLPRQSMAQWVGLSAHWLKLIYEHIRTGVMAGGYVQIDETPIRYLEPGNGKTKLGYLWTCNRPDGDVVYHWQTTRAATCLDKIVPVDFTGTIQCDGYAGYPAFARGRGETIALAACWAHARRAIYEAKEQAPQQAGWILRQIAHLYRIEEKLRKGHAGPQLRAAVRAHQSRPIHDRLHRLLAKLKVTRRHLPQSLMGKAIDYTLGLWPLLGVYLEDGRVEIDNNLVENAIRPTAIGKKNWLFIGEADAGERGAILYTIIENCRRRGIDPYAYLRDVLSRLPSMTNWQIKDITPEAWAKSQRPPLRKAA